MRLIVFEGRYVQLLRSAAAECFAASFAAQERVSRAVVSPHVHAFIYARCPPNRGNPKQVVWPLMFNPPLVRGPLYSGRASQKRKPALVSPVALSGFPLGNHGSKLVQNRPAITAK